MKALLTGATGFLGSHLARAFVSAGYEVRATRRATSSCDRLGDAAAQVDWRDAGASPASLVDGVDVILHAATHYGRAAEPAEVARVNDAWPTALLRAAGSRCLFANVDTSLPPALSAYARTKRAFIDRARAAAASGDAQVLNIALESVFGPGDDPAKFQMTLIRALVRDEPSLALTRGEQTRDYIFIADAVDAILRLVQHATASSAPFVTAGVGRGEEVSIRDFAMMVHRIAQSRTRLDFGAHPYRDGELMRARADVTVARSLGWRPQYTVEDGLRLTIDAERTAG